MTSGPRLIGKKGNRTRQAEHRVGAYAVAGVSAAREKQERPPIGEHYDSPVVTSRPSQAEPGMWDVVVLDRNGRRMLAFVGLSETREEAEAVRRLMVGDLSGYRRYEGHYPEGAAMAQIARFRGALIRGSE